MSQKFLVVLVVLGLVYKASGLSCYVCGNCDSVDSNTPKLNCMAPLDACLTSKSNGVVSRLCGTGSNGCNTAGGVETCICRGDNCNGSGTIKVTPIVYISALLLTLLSFKAIF
ncbi:hypothetical protein ScPMuIL_008492 [Solemya velum]